MSAGERTFPSQLIQIIDYNSGECRRKNISLSIPALTTINSSQHRLLTLPRLFPPLSCPPGLSLVFSSPGSVP